MADEISFDISDDHQFKTYVVKQLSVLGERTLPLESMREKLGKVDVLESRVDGLHETVTSDRKWSRVQSAIGPVMVVIHGIAHKFGIF